jgi:hypothetical protein
MIHVPTVIDDYNHWMNGVDKGDQLTANDRANLRCYRTRMPIFLHCLDIARINAYTIIKSRKPSLTQKEFLCDWIKALNNRAVVCEYGNRLSATLAMIGSPPPSASKCNKRHRISHLHPSLPSKRLEGERKDHVATLGNRQERCRYCAYLPAVAKQAGTTPLPTASHPKQKCSYCDVSLCSMHFQQYYGWND